jgi:hypothetical protein
MRARSTATRRSRDDTGAGGPSSEGSPPPARGEEALNSGSPSRDDAATIVCPMCQRPFTPFGRGRWCSDHCRKKAWRRRHQQPGAPIMVPAAGRPRRPITVYACDACDSRALGQQRCDDCGAFMRKIGIGGNCPTCDGPVAGCELVDADLLPAEGTRLRASSSRDDGATKSGRGPAGRNQR